MVFGVINKNTKYITIHLSQMCYSAGEHGVLLRQAYEQVTVLAIVRVQLAVGDFLR